MTDTRPPCLPHDPRSPGQLVEVKIEQLVLHGFAPRDRDRISQAVQRELAQLFAEQGIPASLTKDSSFGRIDAGEFQQAANAHAETVGVRVAQSVYRGLSQ